MGDPVTLVEPTTPPIETATPTIITAEIQDAKPPQSANKNGKKSEAASGGSSFFTWFMVLALLGVWTSVAVVYFDLVDYQGVLGKLVAYDSDGDGDFDVEDAKVLLDEVPEEATRGAARREPVTKDVGLKLREALKQQLAIIHERVEAKKIAKMALAEVRRILAREDEEESLEQRRKELDARVKDRVAARLKEEEEKIEKEETEKALEKLRREREKLREQEGEEEKKEEEEEEDGEKEEEEGHKKRKGAGEKEEKKEKEREVKKVEREDRGKGRDRGKRGRAEKSDRGDRK